MTSFQLFCFLTIFHISLTNGQTNQDLNGQNTNSHSQIKSPELHTNLEAPNKFQRLGFVKKEITKIDVRKAEDAQKIQSLIHNISPDNVYAPVNYVIPQNDKVSPTSSSVSGGNIKVEHGVPSPDHNFNSNTINAHNYVPIHGQQSHTANSNSVSDHGITPGSSNIPQQTNFKTRVSYNYGHNAQERAEESSYMSYSPPEVVPMVEVEAPDEGYYGQNISPEFHGLKGEDPEKEEYFYRKGKWIITIVYGLFALHLTIIAANFLWASTVATFNGQNFNFLNNPVGIGRRKRDTSGVGFGTNLSCVAKFLCELEQMEEIFGVKRTNIAPVSKRIRKEEMTKDSKIKGETSTRRMKRRPRRQISEKRDCSTIYNTCSINFSLVFRLFKFFL